MPVITTIKMCKPNDILRNKCTGTIGNPKPACTFPYDINRTHQIDLL